MTSSKPSQITLQLPSLEDMKSINDKLKLKISNENLPEYLRRVNNVLASYRTVEQVDVPKENFSNRIYTQPSKEENEYNAWYMKCSIKGTSSGKLSGKRIAIKDSVAVGGIPMMNGSRVLEGYIPEYDATVVKRILKEGGEIVGKTTCEDLCFSGASYMTATGPVKNPIDTDYSVGGSSSGSAVALVTGEADMAIGGDQGGSIRSPCSSCGLIGLKPTYSLVPYTGAAPMLPCTDHLGPMTKTVSDCALLLEVIAGFDDGNDNRQRPSYITPEYSQQIYPLFKPERKLKIGILKEGVDICDANVQNIFNKTVEDLKNIDLVEFSTISIANHSNAYDYCAPVVYSGIYDAMIGGCGHGNSISGMQYPSLVEKLMDGISNKSHEVSETLKSVLLLCEYVKANYGPYHFAKSSSLCALLRQEYDNVLQSYDVLIMPTLNRTPAKIPGDDTALCQRIGESLNMFKNTAIFNVTGHPALTMNCGYDEGKFPIGLMIIGKHFDDTAVLNVASIFEEKLNELLK